MGAGRARRSANGDVSKRHETDAQPRVVVCVQNGCRSLCRTDFLLQGFFGVVKNEAKLQNFNRGSQEKLSHIGMMQGKTAVPVNELHAGDIGAVAKAEGHTHRRYAGR